MGFFGWLFNSAKRGSYGRLVAWMERRYGKIGDNPDRARVENYMQDVLAGERAKNDPKKIAGLQKYVQSQKYLGLIKNGH